MDNDSFFDELEQHYANKLPFVVYSRPIDSVIKSWCLNTDTVYTTDTFSESGFVFAPFDAKQSAIFFPRDVSQYTEITVEAPLDTEAESKHFEAVITSDKEKHIQLVSKGIAAIADGKFEKVVLSRVETHKLHNFKPIEAFKRLFSAYTNAMVYCWYHPKIGLWLGATPELLLKLEGQRLTTVSLAGTQPYTSNTQPHWTDKELEEQEIVTHFLMENIAPYAQSTTASATQTVRAGHLWHLKTRLISNLYSNTTLRTIINALHPTPAVCGMPKDKTKAFILDNEGYNRDFYTGFLGELNLQQVKHRNGNRRNVENSAYTAVKLQSNFYVNLRCMQIVNNDAYIYVGGGITKASVAELEWLETCNKAKTVSAILR